MRDSKGYGSAATVGADRSAPFLGSLDTYRGDIYIVWALTFLTAPKQRRLGLEEGCGTGSEESMSVVSASNTSKILPALVACLLALAAVVCLVHTDGIADAPTAHEGHRHTSSSSAPYLTLDLHCLVAVLPGVVTLVWLCLAALHLSVLLAMPVVPTFPPFIPPKALARI